MEPKGERFDSGSSLIYNAGLAALVCSLTLTINLISDNALTNRDDRVIDLPSSPRQQAVSSDLAFVASSSQAPRESHQLLYPATSRRGGINQG